MPVLTLIRAAQPGERPADDLHRVVGPERRLAREHDQAVALAGSPRRHGVEFLE
jgi:hypothetical protein